MRIEVFPDQAAASRHAAEWLLERWRAKSDLLLCAATGDSPTLTYRHFVEGVRSTEGKNPSRVLKLDEWGGLDLNDPATCEHYLRQNLLDPLQIHRARYAGFDSNPDDPAAEVCRIGGWLQQHGPIDLCVLGLGRNGHLAMNEPGARPDQGCHVATLAESTLQHPMLSASRRRPTYGLTLGLADILASREILLLVFGAAKAGPLTRMFSRDVSIDFPASFLWRHEHVLCVADAAATAEVSAETLESLGAIVH